MKETRKRSRDIGNIIVFLGIAFLILSAVAAVTFAIISLGDKPTTETIERYRK